MKILKMLGKLLMCISISMYGLPVYAASVSAEPNKVELTEAAMDTAIGGSMHAEILSAPASGKSGTVKALVAVGNNSCCSLAYALEAVDTSGNVQRTLTSGTILGNQALVISGQGIGSDTIYRARVDFSNSGIAGLEAVDTVWSQFQ